LQALEVIKLLQEIMPIERAKMQLRITYKKSGTELVTAVLLHVH
jgi:hypothetical protein